MKRLYSELRGKRGGNKVMKRSLVFLEQREGVVKQASIDAWNRVQELAILRPDITVTGLLAGPADVRQLEGRMAGTGVLYLASEAGFSRYNPERYQRLITDIMKREACSDLFFADTVLSRDLAPRLSVRLQASLLSGCSIIEDIASEASCTRALYSGSVIASFAPRRPIRIYTTSSRPTHPIIPSETHISLVRLEPPGFIEATLLPVVRGIVMRESGSDVTEAGIIVAGGRGMGSAEDFEQLEELARLLGGVVGASRPVVDEGWRPHAEQIGQTGKTVAPALYVACAISGAPQHLAGIGSARKVVAINSDPHAPIFDVADYGIVGDVHLVLPKLIEGLQEFLKKR